jgi:nuclear pore complex protein Nup93
MASNTGSLFGGGGLGSSTPQSTSLFGSTNATSAFGNTSAAAPQAAPTSSLFGQSQAQPQAQAQAQAQQQPSQSSILGQTQTGSGQAQGRVSTQATQPAFFNSLLERGKKRPLSATGQNGNGNFEDVPSLQLGLDDIRRKARELGTSGNEDPQQIGTKA